MQEVACLCEASYDVDFDKGHAKGEGQHLYGSESHLIWRFPLGALISPWNMKLADLDITNHGKRS